MAGAPGYLSGWIASITPANAWDRWQQCLAAAKAGKLVPEGVWFALSRAIDQAEREAIRDEPPLGGRG